MTQLQNKINVLSNVTVKSIQMKNKQIVQLINDKKKLKEEVAELKEILEQLKNIISSSS
tara:strand:+ start:475 stop:651 length:177 start_codon:yes stop_codon:yes gene_type:complete